MINESEMLGFVTQGAFPIIPLADRKRPCNFPEHQLDEHARPRHSVFSALPRS